MTTSLPIADAVLAEADQGSWCPKLCTHACPVVTATGHQDAVPWSFHRAVSDLGSGRLAPDDVGERLHRCTGCLACRDSCTFEQDVPAQVRAGRGVVAPAAAAEPRLAALRTAAVSAPSTPPAGTDVVLLPGAASSADVAAVLWLLAASGHGDVHVVGDEGCCGHEARDLGEPDLADGFATTLTAVLGDHTIIAMDPHCDLPGRTVAPVVQVFADHVDRLRHDGEPISVTVHDPCLSVRRHGIVEPPRLLLDAVGITVIEPEGSRAETVCSGAGLQLPLLDPVSAAAVARRRVALLGGGPVVTWCDRARDILHDNGADVTSLWQVLADRLGMP